MAGSGEQDSPPGATVTMAVCHADGIDDPAFVGGSAPVSVVGRRSGVQRCLDHAQALRRSCMQKGLEHFSSSFDGNRYRHSRRNDGVSDHCGRLQTQSGGLPSRLFPQASQVRRRFRPRIHPAIDLPILPGPLPWIGDNERGQNRGYSGEFNWAIPAGSSRLLETAGCVARGISCALLATAEAKRLIQLGPASQRAVPKIPVPEKHAPGADLSGTLLPTAA